MNRLSVELLVIGLTTITAVSHVTAQGKRKALPDAEIVGLESVTKKAFSNMVKEKCDGKY